MRTVLAMDQSTLVGPDHLGTAPLTPSKPGATLSGGFDVLSNLR
jgi:hypothetical protein